MVVSYLAGFDNILQVLVLWDNILQILVMWDDILQVCALRDNISSVLISWTTIFCRSWSGGIIYEMMLPRPWLTLTNAGYLGHTRVRWAPPWGLCCA